MAEFTLNDGIILSSQVLKFYLFGCAGSSLRHPGSSVFVVACRTFVGAREIFSCNLGTLSYGMRDLVP